MAQVKAALGGLDPHAVAFAGSLPQEQLHLAMREATAVLNTSTSEGMCNSLLEAMLVGTPVVARANGGNAALVAHGATGLLFESAAEAVAQARRLLDEPGLAAQLVRAAGEHVRRAHSTDAETEGYRKALQLALGGPSE